MPISSHKNLHGSRNARVNRRPALSEIPGSQPKPLIALEIRTSKFGFVVLEGPTRLLDWGVRWFGDGTLRSTVSDRITTLLRFYRPYVVVVRSRTYYSASRSNRFAKIVDTIRAEARRNSTKFKVLNPRRVRDHFASNGPATKHAIASAIARQFAELSWKLPNPRKPYQSEAPAMVIFDAAANGIAFLGEAALSNTEGQFGA
jgi:hypothetical protein